MYSENEAILDFKKKKKKKKKKKHTHTQKDEIEPGDFFFQNVETDQSASRVRKQPV